MMIVNLEITTYEYDLDLKELIINPLTADYSEEIVIIGTPTSSKIKLEIPEKLLSAVCVVLTNLIIKKICPIEVGRYINLYGINQSHKTNLVNQVIKRIERNTYPLDIASQLEDYFKASKKLILEGYVHFRMTNELNFWKECVDLTIDDVLLHSEYMELIRLIGLFIGTPCCETDSLELKFNPDGSCILSDKQNLKIESPPGYENDMMDLLINMSPDRLTVIDSSGNDHNEFLAKLSSKLNNKINLVYRPKDLT